MYGYFCIGFINLMLNNKRLIDFTTQNKIKEDDEKYSNIFKNCVVA